MEIAKTIDGNSEKLSNNPDIEPKNNHIVFKKEHMLPRIQPYYSFTNSCMSLLLY